ncbi:DoxX family protein [Arenibacter sp. GZD96]|uniref:hypothetical protein n=1 Tax=Aurantibrevibacter litoralis TaxID=3106030 RepID=UPI002AFF9AF8|nr:hypothetical protein [Arenibacter sp. GZD-96]MEA1786465.1 DoxX family protein [Arenibacter sp. GZD-96]
MMMTTIFNNATEISILLFLCITFAQSGIDKIIDWEGNLSWLKSHFKKTIFKTSIPLLLGILIVLEMASGLLSALGIVKLVLDGTQTIALYAALFSVFSFLLLLLGQRIAKDYDGARTIAIYFIPAVFLLFLLQHGT